VDGLLKLKKVIGWLKNENVNFEYDDGLVLINRDDLAISIYRDENSLRVEEVIRVPSHVNEVMLNKSLNNLAYNLGMCFCWDGKGVGHEIYRIGTCIPFHMATKKFIISSMSRIAEAVQTFEDMISEYAGTMDCSVLDLSMFMDGDRIDNLNFGALLHLRDTRFGGSWDIFKMAMKKGGGEDARIVISHIDKCIKFEKVNKRKLSDVYHEVKDELTTLFEELDDEVTYN
jgi:hypothetical protein